MKQVVSLVFLAVVLLLSGAVAIADAVLPAPPLGPDLMGNVLPDKWNAKGSALAYDDEEKGFPFITNANGTTNRDTAANLIQTPISAPLTPGKCYQFVLRMKADQFPPGQTITFDSESLATNGDPYEPGRAGAWNVSKAGEWEEIIIPVRPAYNKGWRVQIFVNPTTRFAVTPSKIYIAPDVDLYELPTGDEVVTLRDINVTSDKDAFNSSTGRIDGLGNIYINKDGNKDGTWKHVFPKMIYRDSPATYADYLPMFKRYKSFGFTGVMNMTDAAGADAAIEAGLEHLSMNANGSVGTPAGLADALAKMDAVYQWAEAKGRHHNLVWYNFDNERTWVGNYDYQEGLREHIDTYHVEGTPGKRRHPIYFLNGNVGLPRTYHNASRTIMDFTGSYVGSDSLGEEAELNPDPSMLVHFMSQNQQAPVTIIQLQTRIGKTFIPSLFYGIILGGKAMSVWRDGGTTEPALEDALWSSAFRDDVSPRIDQMLPLIEQPHFTTWKAWTNQFPNVRIGTRELNGAGYLILANFSVTDVLDTPLTLPVTVTLQNTQATKAVDFFTGAEIATIENGQFTLPLGYHNKGYQVIHLVNPVSIASAQAEELTSTSARIRFVLNRKAQAQIEYGLTTDYGSWTAKETSFNYAEHLQPLTGLRPNTTYHYRVHTWDENGNEVISEDHVFTTARGFNWLLTMPAILGNVDH